MRIELIEDSYEKLIEAGEAFMRASKEFANLVDGIDVDIIEASETMLKLRERGELIEDYFSQYF